MADGRCCRAVVSKQKKGNEKEAINRNSNLKNVSVGSADELKKYKELLDIGAITQQEFEETKKKILSQL